MDNTLFSKSNAEVAKILGKSIPTVVRMRKRLGLPAKTGRRKILSSRNCLFCGDSFDARYSKHWYCSCRCAGKAHMTDKRKEDFAVLARTSTHRQREGWGAWNKNPNVSDYRRYANRVHRLTRRVYDEHRDIINPENHPRTRAGTPGGWQLDHIMSIHDAYKLHWPAEKVAELNNLRMLPWRDNLARNRMDAYDRVQPDIL